MSDHSRPTGGALYPIRKLAARLHYQNSANQGTRLLGAAFQGALFVGGLRPETNPAPLSQLGFMPLSDILSEAVAQIDEHLKLEKHA